MLPTCIRSAVAGTVLLTMLAGTSLAQQAQDAYRDDPQLPAGIVGARITSLIATFNSGDSATIERFLEDECTGAFRNFTSLDEHLAIFQTNRWQWGELTFHSIRTYTPPREGETIVIVQDGNFGAWRGFTVRFDPRQDFRISGLGVRGARPPANARAPRLTEEDLHDELEALLTRLCERDIFSGTVLVARGDSVRFTHACGEASKRFHVPNDLETRFNLGSMNKMFTSVAVMQLVEQGRVAVNDPIGKYVDETWLPREVTDRIQVHHLLTHTSGLGSYFNDTYWNSSRALYRALEDYKPLIRNERPAFEPGSDWRYSNTGMFLLGVVIERASGQDYFDYIREHIYGPAGMTRSDSYEMDQPVDNLAIGYDPAPDAPWGYENNLFKHVIKGGPAGGGFSTVGDLHRFATALLTGTLVSEGSKTRLWTDYFGREYGYGFSVGEGPGGKVVGHGGGFPGISASLQILVDRGWIVAVLSNYGRAAAPVAERIQILLSQMPAGRS